MRHRNPRSFAVTLVAAILAGCGGSRSTTASSPTSGTQSSHEAELTACVGAWNDTSNPYRAPFSLASKSGVSSALVFLFADGRCGVAADVPGQEGGVQGVYTAFVQSNAGFTILEAAGGPAGVASSLALSQQLVQQAGTHSNATIDPDGSLAAMPGASIVHLAVNSDGTTGTTQPSPTSPSTPSQPTASSSASATNNPQAPPAPSTSTTNSTPSQGSPTATYCEDGSCTTVACPPTNPNDEWICATSSNPAAREAVGAK